MKHRSMLFAAVSAACLLAASPSFAWGHGPGPGWHGGWQGGGGWHGGWHAGWRGPGWRGPGWGPRWWGPGVYVGPPVIYPAPGVVIYP